MRWSASSNATLSLRTFNCFKRSSARAGESLPITRYSAPYCDRRSRSIVRKTSESSSTLSKIGFAMIRLSCLAESSLAGNFFCLPSLDVRLLRQVAFYLLSDLESLMDVHCGVILEPMLLAQLSGLAAYLVGKTP